MKFPKINICPDFFVPLFETLFNEMQMFKMSKITNIHFNELSKNKSAVNHHQCLGAGVMPSSESISS